MEGGDSRVSAEGGAKQQLVDSFVAVTSSSREEALFFLESHNWELAFAIHSFFEASDPRDDLEAPLHRPQQRRRRRQQEHEEEEGEGEDEDDEDYVPPADPDLNSSPPRPLQEHVQRQSGMSSQDKKGKKAAGGSRPSGGIHTLADLNREPSGPGSDSDSDGPQEYYTGGEKSGMLVQDPSKRNHDVDALFEQAKQMGAREGSIDDSRPTNARGFAGTGRLLSGENVPPASRPQQPENIVHDILFWTNGFTVDDGPLRKFDDPENASFLESIKKSEYPKELEPSDKRSVVHVNLIRRGEKCPERPERKIPFQGIGRTLGGASSTSAEPSQPIVGTIPTGNSSSLVGLSVDESLPSTSIQLRLADGTRMVARFNNHHTISDIRSFIDASRPGATRNYKLQTVGFPPKQLLNEAQSVEQAGLANSVVIQRL